MFLLLKYTFLLFDCFVCLSVCSLLLLLCLFSLEFVFYWKFMLLSLNVTTATTILPLFIKLFSFFIFDYSTCFCCLLYLNKTYVHSINNDSKSHFIYIKLQLYVVQFLDHTSGSDFILKDKHSTSCF